MKGHAAGRPHRSEDRSMRHTEQIRTPLLAWIVWKIADALAAMKPSRSAADIAFAVARSGNPTGV
ncbi:MAG: hypothetical protein BGN84_09775 [Afipia sp. 62-7]|nr:MAG: hypothetical protein BGN84_09775 [Afipia sp. 62-7]